MLTTIARDIADAIADATNRATAPEIAMRMAGDNAAEAVTRDIAKGVVNNLPRQACGGERQREPAARLHY